MQYKTTWHHIPIQIDYDPDYSNAYREAYGYALAHIEVSTDQALPITETGYKSIFLAEPLVAEYGTAQDYVLAMLDEAGQSPKWQQIEAAQNQLNLF